jgi:hypothetical protein
MAEQKNLDFGGSELEQEASLMGWVPKEHFKGDPSKWVEAEAFVEKGRMIAPILRKNNERLLSEVQALKNENNKLTNAFSELNASIEDLKIFHAESTKAQVAKARSEILSDLRQAKQDGDIDAEVDAQARLSRFDSAGEAPGRVVPKVKPATAPEPIDPGVAAWQGRNPWFGTDYAKTGLAQGIAQELRNQGVSLVGEAFLDKVTEMVEERLGTGKRTDRVEGGRPGGQSGSSGQGYADLPSDARAVCDKQAAKFVGDNKPYKTKAAWNSFFASEYFKGN